MTRPDATVFLRPIWQIRKHLSRDLKVKSQQRRQRITFEKFGGVSAIAKPAFERLTEEVGQMQRRWLWVADIFQMIVDTASEDRVALRRGSSAGRLRLPFSVIRAGSLEMMSRKD